VTTDGHVHTHTQVHHTHKIVQLLAAKLPHIERLSSVTSVSGFPASHVTIANTAQSTLNVGDPDQSRRQQPRDPDDEQKDACALTGR